MKKLPEQFKNAWLAALRSGKFKQDKNYLRTEEYPYEEGDTKTTTLGYCCLGVACVVHNPEQHISSTLELPTSYLLPADVMEVFEQPFPPELNAGIEYEQLQLKLAAMNDAGDSFETIANWIEEKL